MTLVLIKCKDDEQIISTLSSKVEFINGLKEGDGNWNVFEGNNFLVIEVNESDIIDNDNNTCKFRTGNILFNGTKEELANSEFPHKFILNSESAYNWALNIGNRDIMINKIIDSKSAYFWAICIGNRDVMINRITEPEDAYFWAKDFGNHDIMKEKVVKSNSWSFLWNLTFPANRIES